MKMEMLIVTLEWFSATSIKGSYWARGRHASESSGNDFLSVQVCRKGDETLE
jgi:hypothetical protein